MCFVHESTVVIGRVGQRCGEVQLTHGPAWVSDNALYPKRMLFDCDAKFFALALSAAGLNSVKNRNDLPLLTQSILHAVKLPWPPSLHEQGNVVATLSDLERLLSGLDRLIVKKRNLKQAAMQQLLTGQTRLPGFSGEWDSHLLGSLAEVLKGAGLSKSKLSAFGRTSCILYGDLFTTYGRAITSVHGRTDSPEGTPSVFGDVLMPGSTTTTGIDLATASALLMDHVSLGGDINIIRQYGNTYSPTFLAYYLTHIKRQSIAELSQGITIHHLYGRDLKGLMLRLPELAEQTAIANVLADMEAEIGLLEQRRDKTRALKQAMMQELLTGRIRLIGPSAQVVPLAAAKTAAVAKRGHNEHFNEAVVIAALAQRFAGEDYPLGRFRYTKLSYLLHRHAERNTEQYLRKAAGPYNPKTRYGGAEKIALERGYVREHHSGKYSGFVAADNVAEAERYFRDWYGDEVLPWLEQFRKASNDDLELFTTVFGAMDEVAGKGGVPSLKSVKQFIADDPEWRAKLQRPLFSDDNIVRAGRKYRELFGEPPKATPPT